MSFQEKNDEAYSKISQHVLKLLNPEGSGGIPENIDKTLQETREARKEIMNIYFSNNSTESDKVHEEYKFMENLTDGTFHNMLNHKADLLLPGMKVDNNLDVTKSVDHFTQSIKDLHISTSRNENVELTTINEAEGSKSLDTYNETIKRIYSRLANIQISEDLDMAKKRNSEVENKIRELKDITDCVNKFFAANANVSEAKKFPEMPKDDITDDQLMKNIEKLLTETDSVMYAINCHINSK